VRTPVAALAALSALILAACGTESVSVPSADGGAAAGAEIFATNCAGCHTLGPAGSNGSGNRALRAQGPNFDQRLLTSDEVLFAIRNGGYSGAIMPQSIVVGEEASLVAEFVSEYSGTESEDSVRPSPAGGTETGEEPAAAEETGAEPTDAAAANDDPAPETEAGGASGGGAQGRSGQGDSGSGSGGAAGSGSIGGGASGAGSTGGGSNGGGGPASGGSTGSGNG